MQREKRRRKKHISIGTISDLIQIYVSDWKQVLKYFLLFWCSLVQWNLRYLHGYDTALAPYVLRLDLNSFKDDVWRSDMGRLFQSFGPTCENVRSPQVCLICGNCKVCEVDERRLREGL